MFVLLRFYILVHILCPISLAATSPQHRASPALSFFVICFSVRRYGGCLPFLFPLFGPCVVPYYPISLPSLFSSLRFSIGPQIAWCAGLCRVYLRSPIHALGFFLNSLKTRDTASGYYTTAHVLIIQLQFSLYQLCKSSFSFSFPTREQLQNCTKTRPHSRVLTSTRLMIVEIIKQIPTLPIRYHDAVVHGLINMA